MLLLDNNLKAKLAWFTSKEGQEALEDLSDALYTYYAKECTISEGTELSRNQGIAQIAVWLKSLPKGLRNGNGT